MKVETSRFDRPEQQGIRFTFWPSCPFADNPAHRMVSNRPIPLKDNSKRELTAADDGGWRNCLRMKKGACHRIDFAWMLSEKERI